MMGLIIPALLALAVIVLLFMTVRIVPQRQIYVVERLGNTALRWRPVCTF